MTLAGRAGRLRGAAIVGVVGGALAWAVLLTGTLSTPRSEAADLFRSVGPVDDRVVVLAIDGEFIDAANRNSLLWEYLMTRLHGAPLLLQPELAELSNPGVRVIDWEVSFVDYVRGSAGGKTVAIATDVVLGAEGADDVPSLLASELDPALAAVAGAVAFDELGVLPPPPVLRTAPLLARTEADGPDRIVASSSLAALSMLDGAGAEVSFRPHSIRLGDRDIPTEADREVRIGWVPQLLPGGSAVVSALPLARGEVDPETFAGKVVLLGVTDPRAATMVRVPTGEAVPLVNARANLVNTLLTEHYRKPMGTEWIVVVVGLMSLVVAWLVLELHFWQLALPLVGGIGVSVALAAWQVRHGIVPDPLLMGGTLLVSFATALGLRAFSELRGRRELARRFEQYVPASTIRGLLRAEPGAVTAARRADCTVLFADIRGFTTIAEALAAADVAELLNRFYDTVSDAVMARGGTVMQFVGDEVLAVFGIPLTQPDHVDRAVACALEMLDRRERLAGSLEASGLPAFEFGIGIHCGELVAADVGGERRRQFAVMGDTVNVASRLCNHAAGGQVVASEELLAAVTYDVAACPLGLLRLKGVTRDVRGFVLTRNDGDAPAECRPDR